MKNIILISAFAILLAGCASTETYQEPTQSASKAPLATIEGFDHSKSLYTWHAGRVISIDNKDVSYGYFVGNMSTYQIPVTPAQHLFVVLSQFNRGFSWSGSTGPYEGITQIQATLAPGHHYHLNGIVDGASIKLWIEDANGKRISNTATTSYRIEQNNTVFVPMYVK